MADIATDVVPELIHQNDHELDEGAVESDDEEFLFQQYRAHTKTLHWLRRPLVSTLGVALFVFAVAAGMIGPPTEVIYAKMMCNSLIVNGGGTCDPVQVQLALANYRLYQTIVTNVLSIIVGSKMGELSDKFGRKPFLLWLFICVFLSTAGTVYMVTAFNTFHFWMALLTELVLAFGGGITTGLALSKAYTSDVVEPAERVTSFGLVMAFVMVGMSISPLLVSLLARLANHVSEVPHSPVININGVVEGTFEVISTTDTFPLKVGLFLLLIVVLYAAFFLPESRSARAQHKARATGGPQTWMLYLNFVKPLQLLTFPDSVVLEGTPKTSVRKTRFLFVSMVLTTSIITTAVTAVAIIGTQYGIYKFKWQTVDVANFSFFTMGLRSIMMVFGLPFFDKVVLRQWLGFRRLENSLDMVDFAMIFVGLSWDGVFNVLTGVAGSTSQLIAFQSMAAIGVMGDPAVVSSCIKYLPEVRVGEFLGGLSLFQNILNLVVPLAVFSIYKFGLQHSLAGLPYLVMGILYFLGAALITVNKHLIRLDRHSEDHPLLTRKPSVLPPPNMEGDNDETDETTRLL